MTTIKKIVLLGCMGLLSQCSTTSPSQSPSTGGGNARVDVEATVDTDDSVLAKGCPLDKMQWLYASQKFDLETQNQLVEKIAKSALDDASTMDRLVANKNSNPMAVSSALKVFIEKSAITRTPVSDEFYQQYVNSRMTMCAVMDALRSGSIKQDERSKVAGNTFRDVAKSFEKLNKKTE